MSVNKVILLGFVGKDPDVKHFDNGSSVANFTLATTEKGYTTQAGVTVPDRTEWHNISCWRGLAKVVEQYVKKGSQVYLEGTIRTRSYEDNQGVKRYVTEIYADNIELLGKREQQANSQPAPDGVSEKTPPPANPATEDDLPF